LASTKNGEAGYFAGITANGVFSQTLTNSGVTQLSTATDPVTGEETDEPDAADAGIPSP